MFSRDSQKFCGSVIPIDRHDVIATQRRDGLTFKPAFLNQHLFPLLQRCVANPKLQRPRTECIAVRLWSSLTCRSEGFAAFLPSLLFTYSWKETGVSPSKLSGASRGSRWQWLVFSQPPVELWRSINKRRSISRKLKVPIHESVEKFWHGQLLFLSTVCHF